VNPWNVTNSKCSFSCTYRHLRSLNNSRKDIFKPPTICYLFSSQFSILVLVLRLFFVQQLLSGTFSIRFLVVFLISSCTFAIVFYFWKEASFEIFIIVRLSWHLLYLHQIKSFCCRSFVYNVCKFWNEGEASCIFKYI
jgi:hypothetical protein